MRHGSGRALGAGGGALTACRSRHLWEKRRKAKALTRARRMRGGREGAARESAEAAGRSPGSTHIRVSRRLPPPAAARGRGGVPRRRAGFVRCASPPVRRPLACGGERPRSARSRRHDAGPVRPAAGLPQPVPAVRAVPGGPAAPRLPRMASFNEKWEPVLCFAVQSSARAADESSESLYLQWSEKRSRIRG